MANVFERVTRAALALGTFLTPALAKAATPAAPSAIIASAEPTNTDVAISTGEEANYNLGEQDGRAEGAAQQQSLDAITQQVLQAQIASQLKTISDQNQALQILKNKNTALTEAAALAAKTPTSPPAAPPSETPAPQSIFGGLLQKFFAIPPYVIAGLTFVLTYKLSGVKLSEVKKRLRPSPLKKKAPISKNVKKMEPPMTDSTPNETIATPSEPATSSPSLPNYPVGTPIAYIQHDNPVVYTSPATLKVGETFALKAIDQNQLATQEEPVSEASFVSQLEVSTPQEDKPHVVPMVATHSVLGHDGQYQDLGLQGMDLSKIKSTPSLRSLRKQHSEAQTPVASAAEDNPSLNVTVQATPAAPVAQPTLTATPAPQATSLTSGVPGSSLAEMDHLLLLNAFITHHKGYGFELDAAHKGENPAYNIFNKNDTSSKPLLTSYHNKIVSEDPESIEAIAATIKLAAMRWGGPIYIHDAPEGYKERFAQVLADLQSKGELKDKNGQTITTPMKPFIVDKNGVATAIEPILPVSSKPSITPAAKKQPPPLRLVAGG